MNQYIALRILVREVLEPLRQCRLPLVTLVGGWTPRRMPESLWILCDVESRTEEYGEYAIDHCSTISRIRYRDRVTSDSVTHEMDDRVRATLAGIP